MPDTQRDPADRDGVRSGMLARVVDRVLEATVVATNTKIGPAVRRRLAHWTPPPRDALAGRTAVVTGATSGIGRALAGQLAGIGAIVHVVGRDLRKVEQVVDEIGGDAVGHVADLTRLADVRALADELAGSIERVDVLAHVAGVMVHGDREDTADGIETTAQVHVVAPFLLTRQLLPLLEASGDARVITMASAGMYTRRLDVGELFDPPEPFDGTKAYARAKRAQVALNAEWARRYPDRAVAFHATHPGWVDTPGLREGLPGFARFTAPLLRQPDDGADTACWLAWTDVAPAPDGRFWHDRRPRATVLLPWTRTRDGEIERMWAVVADRAGTDA